MNFSELWWWISLSDFLLQCLEKIGVNDIFFWLDHKSRNFLLCTQNCTFHMHNLSFSLISIMKMWKNHIMKKISKSWNCSFFWFNGISNRPVLTCLRWSACFLLLIHHDFITNTYMLCTTINNLSLVVCFALGISISSWSQYDACMFHLLMQWLA